MSNATVMIGQTLDRYRIVSKLGEGGMGVVYKARDEHLNRTVAVKVLPADRVADPARKERFVREARAASALNHPGIVTIHDIRSEGGVDFILMEYVEGRTLSDLIAGLRHPQALKYAVQIADAMAGAHAAGILHRDLKPSNVMVTHDDRIKILDFGLAKLIEPKDSSPDSPTVPAHMLTLEGDVIGTAPYMSPEQAEGRNVDARSDIFSFGALLYEMVTGSRAFNGPSRLAILSRILTGEPTPPRQLVPALPADLEKIILRCLRKEPNRRYQSMTDLKIALEDLAIESASQPRVETPAVAASSRRPWLWSLLALPLFIAAAFFTWRTWRASRPGESLRATALTTFAGVELDPSLSPDGNHVAFTWNGEKQDNTDVYVQMIGSGAPLRLTTDPRTEENPVWSPDGRWIAFLRFESIAPMSRGRAELRLIAPLGGPERKLADIHTRRLEVQPRFLTWCPDSKCVVVSDSAAEGQPDALFVVSLETGEKRRLTNPQAPILADTSPAISPDGRTLAFRRVASWSSGDLYFLSLGEGVTAEETPMRRVNGGLNPDYPAWMPDSEEILFAAKGGLWRVDADGERPERLPFVGEDGAMPAISSSGDRHSTRLVYARTFEDENVWRLDLSTPVSASAPAIASSRSDTHPKFSSSGRRVAITSTRSGDWEIWTTDPDGGNAVQLTSMGARATGAPCWSPDDEQIVFASDLEGQFDVYAVSSAGGKPRRLTSAPSFEHGPSFSRDGRWIYFCSNRSGDYQIWRMPASGGEAIQLTRNGGWAAVPSPDGASLYYTGTTMSGATLWRVSVNGGEPERVLDGVRFWVFAPVERGIYYGEDVGSKTRLQFFEFATARSTTVAQDFGDVRYVPSVSTDGRTMLYSRLDASINDLMLVENFR